MEGRQQGGGVIGAESEDEEAFIKQRRLEVGARGQVGEASRQKEQFVERHGNRTTDCPVGCKEKPGVPEVDTGKRFRSQI